MAIDSTVGWRTKVIKSGVDVFAFANRGGKLNRETKEGIVFENPMPATMSELGGEPRVPYLLMYYDDEKARAWRAAAMPLEVEIVVLRGSPILSPFSIAFHVIRRGRPLGLVFRYLNDYPSLVKTLFRIISECVVLCMALAIQIPILWISHNVDRETTTHFPLLTKFRRSLVTYFARRIFVTDPELVAHARLVFPGHSAKIDYVTFGPRLEWDGDSDHRAWPQGLETFLGRIDGERNRGLNIYVGLSIGQANWKTAHFEQSIALLNSAKRFGYEIRLIIIGPIRDHLERYDPDTLHSLRDDPRIFLVDEYTRIDERKLALHTTFYWRAYCDYSVPYSLYNAAVVKKPVLAYGLGFLSEAVRKYSLGAVIEEDYSNIEMAINTIVEWDPSSADRFLETHTWEIGAERLIRAVR